MLPISKVYQDFEQQATGDPIRGLPSKNFPWDLCSENTTDNYYNKWHFFIKCLKVENQRFNHKLNIELLLESYCFCTKKTLDSFNFDSNRLEAFGILDNPIFVHEQNIIISSDIEDVIKKAKNVLFKYKQKTLEKWTSEIMLESIHMCNENFNFFGSSIKCQTFDRKVYN